MLLFALSLLSTLVLDLRSVLIADWEAPEVPLLPLPGCAYVHLYRVSRSLLSQG